MNSSCRKKHLLLQFGCTISIVSGETLGVELVMGHELSLVIDLVVDLPAAGTTSNGRKDQALIHTHDITHRQRVLTNNSNNITDMLRHLHGSLLRHQTTGHVPSQVV